VEVTYRLDADGRIASLAFDRWGDPDRTDTWDWHRFGGEVTGYRTFGGLTIPSEGRLGWFYGGDRWPAGEFFRYRITDLQPVTGPPPAASQLAAGGRRTLWSASGGRLLSPPLHPAAGGCLVLCRQHLGPWPAVGQAAVRPTQPLATLTSAPAGVRGHQHPVLVATGMRPCELAFRAPAGQRTGVPLVAGRSPLGAAPLEQQSGVGGESPCSRSAIRAAWPCSCSARPSCG
jgi:hypothetical protein